MARHALALAHSQGRLKLFDYHHSHSVGDFIHKAHCAEYKCAAVLEFGTNDLIKKNCPADPKMCEVTHSIAPNEVICNGKTSDQNGGARHANDDRHTKDAVVLEGVVCTEKNQHGSNQGQASTNKISELGIQNQHYTQTVTKQTLTLLPSFTLMYFIRKEEMKPLM